MTLSQFSFSQELSNIRVKWYQQFADTVSVDSLSIIPSTFELFSSAGIRIDSNQYVLNEAASELYPQFKISLGDSIKMVYRVFPLNFTEEVARKDRTMMLDEVPKQIDPFVFRPGVIDESYGFDGLNKTGSVSRGIAFGNTQDLSVNSTLNLQLSGKITPEINVLASITDDNLPIQPQGNTQQLQDFDQVFIQLYNSNSKLTAGDFQLKSREGYFFKYFKRAQGGTFETKIPASFSNNGVLLETSAAISKGKFARNLIQGIEGNQGPYRLRGAENERFIIVLAGTERVFIDGRLLQRGQEFDYVIDYNTSEISFTPNQLITKDRRIAVEFQYSDKNYARALLQAHAATEIKNAKFYLNAYSEQDSKNQPLQQELDDEAKQVLALAGDDPNLAVIGAIDSLAYSNSFVQYALVDSLGYDSVLVYSTNPEAAFYRASFSPVSTGLGDYVEDQFTAVGRVYRWVAPDTINDVIIHKGNYAPVSILVPPKKQQGFNAGMRYEKGNTSFFFEGALSVLDKNTFSNLNQRDDVGTAFTSSINQTLRLNSDSLPWLMKSTFSYEFVQQYFERLERFRAVEFERNWNILGQSINSDQHIIQAGLNFQKKQLGDINVGGESFLAGSEFSGYKALLKTNLNNQKFKLFTDASYMLSDGVKSTEFLRHRAEVNRKFGSFLIGYKDEHERNKFFESNPDSLARNSYQFYEWQTYGQWGDSAATSLRTFYGGRTDWQSDQISLVKSAIAEQYGARLGFNSLKNQSGSITISNRRLRILNAGLIDQEPESTLLGRLEHRLKAAKGAITTDLFYELGSGLEQRREFLYLEVPAGQGVYVWIDYNDDGVKDLNEFEVAQYTYEANYIRSFTPTDQYVKVFNNQFSLGARINPAALLKGANKEGFLGFVSRFSDQFSYKSGRKTNREDGAERFNPFSKELADEALLTQSISFRNTVFFNRTGTDFGADYTFQRVENKSLLTGGFESRLQEYNQLRFRWNPVRTFTVEVLSEEGRKNNASDFLSNRNYLINYEKIGPSVSWQPQNEFRLTVNGNYTQKKNQEELGGEKAELIDLGMELRYNVATKGSLLLNFKTVDITYTGVGTDNSLSFEMLESLRPGTNFTWSAGIQKNLSGNIQINLNYNGRQSEGIRTIHAGGVQVRAYF